LNVGLVVALILSAIGCSATAATVRNLAPKAKVSATSEAGESNLARFAVDGRIPAAGTWFADYRSSWAANGKATGNKGSFVLEWPKSVTAAEIIYYGRTAWGFECFKDYEVYLDRAKQPAAKGALKAIHGPQRIKFRKAKVRKITIKFLNGHPNIPNAGASEIMVLTKSPTDAELKRLVTFQLNSVFSDHMVLQRRQPVAVLGTAVDGEKVKVSFRGQTVSATAKNGRWLARLKPMKVGRPATLKVSTGWQTFTCRDVLVGEVWIASGQSNMEMPVGGRGWPTRYGPVTNSKQEIAAAKYPDIRFCFVTRQATGSPMVEANCQQWIACSPETVSNVTAIGYFFARRLHKELNVPVGVIDASWGATCIEPWTAPAGFAGVPSLKDYCTKIEADRVKYEALLAKPHEKLPQVSRFQAASLYNAMIHPLTPLTFRGAIWYQGEGNIGNGMAYFDRMKALIEGWRKAAGRGDFPFLFAQLAPYDYGQYKGSKDPYRLPVIWDAQRITLSVPNTGMAVLTDITNIRDIHPPNKQDVGKRLALWALAKTYGRKGLVCSGPLYKSMKVEGGKVILDFNHVGGGLASRDGKPLTWFEIAGADKKFHKAKAVIDGQAIVVNSDSVPKPVAVRFGWHKIANPNLMNKEGLPASPFRTHTW